MVHKLAIIAFVGLTGSALCMGAAAAIGGRASANSIADSASSERNDCSVGSGAGLNASGFVSAVRLISAALPLARQTMSGARPMIE